MVRAQDRDGQGRLRGHAGHADDPYLRRARTRRDQQVKGQARAAARASARRLGFSAGLAFLLFVLATHIVPVTAKSFIFTRVAIEASVEADASLHIGEARTYAFDGDFSWATYRLPLTSTQRIETIRVADERGPYVPSSSGRPGTYTVSRDGDAVVIRWSFRANDESRTFTIAYVVRNAVIVHADVAELYWKFIGTGWDRPSRDVQIAVRLPGRLRANQIRAWGHGPLQGDVRPVDGGALLTVRNLPPATMVEGRIVFPKEVVSGARMRLSTPGLPRILQEEASFAAQANRARLQQRVLLGGLSALPLLALAGWFGLYLRFGREPVPTSPEGYYRELPAEYSPAELGVLWRFGSVQPADFTATVLDLVRRGYIVVEVSGSETDTHRDDAYTLTRTRKSADLRRFESEVFEILFGSDDESVTIARRTGLPEKAKTRMRRRFSQWMSKVSEAAKVHGFFDSTSMRMRWIAAVLGILVLCGTAWLTIALWSGIPRGVRIAGAAAAASGLILAIGSGAVARRSQRGAEDLRRWQGFRRFLLDFSEMKRAELPSLAIWEHYLVYAVPLGVAHRVAEQLRKIYPTDELVRSPGLGPWVSSSSGGRGDPLASFSAFTTAFASATSSATSSSGGGGGFSGGGGGGGGGSGGSAG